MTDIGLKYFTREELCCKGSGVLKLADGFGEYLDQIRATWGKPLTVTSCCRSAEYNKTVGGAAQSYHVFNNPKRNFATCAVDIAIAPQDRMDFVKMLLTKFPDASIGVAKGFIHTDRRTKYTGLSPTLFTYD